MTNVFYCHTEMFLVVIIKINVKWNHFKAGLLFFKILSFSLLVALFMSAINYEPVWHSFNESECMLQHSKKQAEAHGTNLCLCFVMMQWRDNVSKGWALSSEAWRVFRQVMMNAGWFPVPDISCDVSNALANHSFTLWCVLVHQVISNNMIFDHHR